MKDTRTPFLVNVVENVINVALAFALVTDLVTPGGYGVQGLAWAWSGAYTVAAVIALVVLHRRLGTFGPAAAAARSAISRVAVAGVVMAAAVWVAIRVLDGTAVSSWVLAGVGTLVGLGVYVGLTIVLRVPEIRDLAKVVLRRG
jgi:putative peptidoglycan lipid II flippase